jgi:Flp pilus assembly protein TadB
VTVIVLAIGISACVALPVAGAVGVALWVRSFRQGRHLDRSGGGQ